MRSDWLRSLGGRGACVVKWFNALMGAWIVKWLMGAWWSSGWRVDGGLVVKWLKALMGAWWSSGWWGLGGQMVDGGLSGQVVEGGLVVKWLKALMEAWWLKGWWGPGGPVVKGLMGPWWSSGYLWLLTTSIDTNVGTWPSLHKQM